MEKLMIDIREESEQIRRIFQNKDYVTIETLLATIEELDDEKSNLEDKYKELQNMVEECYEPKKTNPYQEYGISKNDFI